MSNGKLTSIANQIRKDIVQSVYLAGAGHLGGSLSVVEVLTYLYFGEMNLNPLNPHMENRDRFVLSKGHAAPALYATLAERGYFPVEDLQTLSHQGSYLQGHPDMIRVPGVDMSTGSLGQGLSAAVGMALSARFTHQYFDVYALLGDGELQEGQIWEALMFAGHQKLANLTVIIDNNDLQVDGNIQHICSPYPLIEKLSAFNFHVINVPNGHDFELLKSAFSEAKLVKDMPVAIILKTIKGKGIPFMENKREWHSRLLTDSEYHLALAVLEHEDKLLC